MKKLILSERLGDESKGKTSKAKLTAAFLSPFLLPSLTPTITSRPRPHLNSVVSKG